MKEVERKILLNPGPATTSDSVKYAQIVPDICPREEEFTQIMREVREGLIKITQCGEDYSCVLFGGSGTAAMDSVINSVVHEKRLLIIKNGYYGERFSKIAKSYNIDFCELNFDMEKEINLLEIEQKLKEDKEIGYIAVVHHETTTGILNPIKEIGELCKKYNCVFIVDTISSFGGVPFNVKDCNIDFMMSTSNKCIHAMPGVCFVIARKKELDKLEGKEKRSFYLDLYDQYKYFEVEETGQGVGGGQTRFTPPVQAIYSLRQAIKEFFDDGGITERYKKYSKNYELLIKGITKLGFKPLHREEIHSKISTTFLEQESTNVDFKKLHDKLYERGFIIYPNKVEIEGKTVKAIRFANMGEINEEDMNLFLENLKEVLEELKEQTKESTDLTAVILAAGMGRRLKGVWDNPKSLFEINGKSLLEYSLDALAKSGIKKCVIVVGYKGEMIKEKIGNNYRNVEIKYVENKDYLTTDTIYSLYMTKELINTSIITLEADLLYDPSIIKKIVDSKDKNLIIVANQLNKNSESLAFSEDGINVTRIGGDVNEDDNVIGEYMGISKLSKEFVEGLFSYFEKEYLANNKKTYCEKLFYEFSKKYKNPLMPLMIHDLPWSGMNNEENIRRLKEEIFPKIYKIRENKL